MADERERSSISILIVDDEPIVGSVVSKYLRQAGYQNVVFLSNPELALDWVKEFRPTMVLLDVFMGAKSGLEVLQDIRDDPSLDEVTVMMLSSAGQEEQFKSLEMGAMGFIQKPTTQKELDSQIQRTLKVASRVRKL